MQKGIDYIGVGSGALVFDNKGRVLISKRGKKSRNEVGKWEFPGGSVEFGENCEDAIVREIKEEFDILIEVIELLEVVNHIIWEEKQHWVAPSYIARHIKGTPKIMEPHKIDKFKWVFLDEIIASKLSLVSQKNLITYLDKYGPKTINL